jgi:hypothetical protein
VWTLKQRSRGWCAGWLIVAHDFPSSPSRRPRWPHATETATHP